MLPVLFAALISLISCAAAASSPCAAITDDKSRLQCYDAENAAVAKQPEIKVDPFVAAAQARVKQQLRDPRSAVFHEMTIKTVAGERGICGEVNAKNAFGGMTGFIPFAYDGKNAYVMSFNAGVGNPTIMTADIWGITLGTRLKAHDKWCDSKKR